MTITVAMALSGLEPEQWNDGLKEIYMQGAMLFPKSPSTLSLASSGASSYYSLESGISSMSPDSVSYFNHFSGNDIDSFGLDGMTHHNEITPLEGDIKSKMLPATSIGMKKFSSREKTGMDVNENLRTYSPIDVAPGKVYSKVMYGGRNILNLFDNMNGGWQYQTSILPSGMTREYFENRSQYSRIHGASPPICVQKKCRHCGFMQCVYM